MDGLRERLAEYKELGARFAKWRAVIDIGPGIPTRACIQSNAHALARYAALCQEADIVPIVEPEVLMDGGHDIAACAEVTEAALRAVFAELYEAGVILEGALLKPNMVLPGRSLETSLSKRLQRRQCASCAAPCPPPAARLPLRRTDAAAGH